MGSGELRQVGGKGVEKQKKVAQGQGYTRILFAVVFWRETYLGLFIIYF